MGQLSFLIVFLFALFSTVKAQDPVESDPKHYKVEFQNSQVRVLRISYGPHEKSTMHEHPEGVVVFVTDGEFRFALAGGKKETRRGKAGQTMWTAREKHAPENLSDKPFEAVLIEMRTKQATTQ